MKIIRVFPRKTRGTPDDELAVVGSPRFFDKADEVHISVLFTWDIPEVERLEKEWKYVAPVKIGGPATNMRGNGFIPGQYVKHGYVITSRGCPNKCWFCSVWKREGHDVRELPIMNGHNVLDDNLLACSDEHIQAVFEMLARQKRGTVEFTGGLEAKRLKPWHVKELKKLNPKQIFFAYDTPDDLEPLRYAGKLLHEGGFKSHPASHSLRCFVLCGYPNDSLDKAEKRIHQTMNAGFFPMAMLWRDEDGERTLEWSRWQRKWARPAAISRMYRNRAMAKTSKGETIKNEKEKRAVTLDSIMDR